MFCEKPYPKKEAMPYVYNHTNDQSQTASQKDSIWIATNLELPEETTSSQNTLTWGAFNSLITKRSQQTNVGTVAPLLRDPPSGYSTFFTTIMRAKSINDNIMGPGHKTIMSFDLQLYDMAMRLWMVDPFIKNNFLFRPGELHTTFWALQSIGRYIAGSGLDQAWIEAGKP
jgi:hypothetical protein